MSRRRTAGSQPESFQLRWHSVANPGTPSVDIMSSPDPLNDPTTPDHVPSSNTRRITRSQRSHKFLSLGASPRKQAYELDVSGGKSSQRLVVSVEGDEENEENAQDGDTRRSLFPTPIAGPASTSRRRERTTTTTVPLKYSIEDESSDVLGSTNATPRPRKTRVRMSNGTPIPKPSARKRQAPTPSARRSHHQEETVADSMESDSMSDTPLHRSPTPKRRAMTPRKRVAEPSSELGTEPLKMATSARRTARKRRRAMAPDELVELADVANNAAVLDAEFPSEDDLQRDNAAATLTRPNRRMPTPTSDANPDSDIWMTTLSQDVTPRAIGRPTRTPTPPRQEHEPSTAMSEGDYGYLAPAVSDDFSADDELPQGSEMRTNDTIAQGEDFSMIFMDSIPALHASMHGDANPGPYSDLGEETNHIINDTLESLRQGEVADQEDEGDDDDDDGADTLDDRENEADDAYTEDDAVGPETVKEVLENVREPEVHSTDLQLLSALPSSGSESEAAREGTEENSFDLQRDVDQEVHAMVDREIHQETAELHITFRQDMDYQLRKEPEEEQEIEEVMDQASDMTPSRQHGGLLPVSPQSRRLSQSPRKSIIASPLRHRVLKQSALATDSTRANLDSLDSYHAEPQAVGSNSMLYEDSFSEIPEAVLAAATPRRPGTTYTYDELDDEEMEQVMSEIEPSQMQDSPADAVAYLGEPEEQNELIEAGDEYLFDGAAMGKQLAAEHEQNIEEELPSEQDEADLTSAEEDEEGQINEKAFLTDDGAEEVGDQHMEEENEEPALATNLSAAQPGTNPPSMPGIAPIRTESEVEEEDEEEAPVPASSGQPQIPDRPFLRSPSRAHQNSPTPRPHPVPISQQTERTAQRNAAFWGETPRNKMSSPVQQQPHSLVQEPASAQHIRPALSSIVRVGRVLQSVTSDPPSPEAGDVYLRSPFRSSGSKEPRSGSRETEGSRLASRSPSARVRSRSPTARVLSFGKSSMSPQRRSPPLERTRRADATAAMINPTHASPSPQRQFIYRERTRSIEPRTAILEPSLASVSPWRSVEAVAVAPATLPAQDESQIVTKPTSGPVSANSSLQHSIPTDVELSWVADEGPISPNLRGDNTLKDVMVTSTRPAGRTSIFSRSPTLQTALSRDSGDEHVPEPEPEEAESEPEEKSPEPVVRDDETDIWEFEAQREAPTAPRQRPFGTSNRTKSQTPHRATVPSPWMRRSIQASSHRLNAPFVPVQPAIEDTGSPSRLEEDAEEYSLLARKRAAEEAQKLSESAVKASKFDLSLFFSSPAVIPGMLADKFFPGKSKAAETASTTVPAPQAGQVMTTGNMFPLVPQMEFVPSSASRRSLFSPASPERTQPEAPVLHRSESPATPEQLNVPRASLSQDQTFTPRARQPSHSFAQPSSTVPTAASAATPPRMQLSRADIRKWQQDAHVSSASSNVSDDSFVRPLLRPLPPKHVSPTKSSLRSPMKPRTPGRVVEFTSSVLSPLEQAHARQQRYMSQSTLTQSMSFFDQDENENTIAGGFGAADQVTSSGRENPDSSDIAMEDAPPLRNGDSHGQALSQTVWTRHHWVLLDELIRARRLGQLDRHYKRQSDKYLGKTVTSRGEGLKLERWHLDCVDAFRAEVGGWDGGIVARRLFALILGETRRGTEQLQTGQHEAVMFH